MQNFPRAAPPPSPPLLAVFQRRNTHPSKALLHLDSSQYTMMFSQSLVNARIFYFPDKKCSLIELFLYHAQICPHIYQHCGFIKICSKSTYYIEYVMVTTERACCTKSILKLCLSNIYIVRKGVPAPLFKAPAPCSSLPHLFKFFVYLPLFSVPPPTPSRNPLLP